MKKFPLTAKGVADFQTELYQLNDPVLLKEALSTADDILSWTARHFEIEVFLLEGMRSLPHTFRRSLGWCLAACILDRQPFVLENLLINGKAEHSASSCLSFQIVFSRSYDCSNGNSTAKGHMDATVLGSS